ncbi:MAG TPA: DUF2069 domain-containing protein [Thermomonas sp.]|jgi:uncharacterized membrane protein|uniref:DUF2069 domain-containing protein n=1 Tax=Thermomonas sp. TaxID=1971895 RepID=UPI002B731972|nr:DUF2069 domain-containing protein [Thermomonas sp.]HOV95353.1 DUF2069 domain-containing protein [Thermomonas sp.]
MNPTRYLATALLVLAGVYVAWALQHPHPLAGLLAFAAPPALLAIGALRTWPRIGFIASVFALLWFSHGVMLLWADPAARGWAATETLLALVVIHAACLPGYRARRTKRQEQQ